MRKLLLILILFVLIILGSISLFNTLTLPSPQVAVKTITPSTTKTPKVLERLSACLKLRTVAPQADSLNQQIQRDLKQFVQKNFQRIYESPNIKIEYLEQAVVFVWKGIDPKLQPILLVGDLVLREPSLESLPQWSFSPFMGKVAEGKIWGAGSMESKAMSTALLEAWEQLLEAQEIPERSMILALRFAADSSKSWTAIASFFKKSGINPAAIYACNGQVALDGCLNIQKPVAWVGCGEQQLLYSQIDATDYEALQERLQHLQQKSFAVDWQGGYTQSLEKRLLAELPFQSKWLMANRSLLGNWMEEDLKSNAKLATALYADLEVQNLKDLGTDGGQATIEWQLPPDMRSTALKQAIAPSLKQFNLSWTDSLGSAQSSLTQGYAFDVLETTIKQCMDNPIVFPGIEQYSGFYSAFHPISPNCYQFSPLQFHEEDYHKVASNIDQALAEKDYFNAVDFYYQLLKNTVL